MADENEDGKPGADNVTFEAWLEGQSDEIKARCSYREILSEKCRYELT